MKRFRNRLTLIMIAVIGVSVLIAGILMGQTFKRNYIRALEDNMMREIRLIDDQMVWKNGSDEQQFIYYTERAQHLKKITKARITFIRGDGTVLGDSDHDPRTMDNHLSRAEIKVAEASGVGEAIRYSDTLNENLLYVAMKVETTSGQFAYIRLALSLVTVDETVKHIWRVLIVGLIVLFLIAAFVSYRIARSLTRPLEQITRVAQRIRNLDYYSRVKVRKSDEIGELGLAINSMADSLQDQMTRISQNESQLESILDNMVNGVIMIAPEGHIVTLNPFAEGVLGVRALELIGRHYSEVRQQYELQQIIQDALNDRQHVREEVTLYYPEQRLMDINVVPVYEDNQTFDGVLVVLQDLSAIRRLERMRSDFVANVSHELKTPIAAVKGFSETLLAGAVDDPQTARAFLQIIYDESERLNRLIGDILDLSAIESRGVPLHFSPVDLQQLLKTTMEVLATEAGRKQIQLHYEAQPELFIEADEDRMRQIVMNLLGNGIAYTPEGGKVTITACFLADDRVQIQISDTGVGIPKKDLPRIFERFYRVDKARSRASGGTGLGLAIVKHLVELHHGTITVESTVGVGTTFTIVLPILQ